jgi:lambda repressor-like predicted transcriptional regulator
MDVKRIVKVELAKRGMTMQSFAKELGIPQQSLSRTLNTPPVNQKSHWPKIMEALELEVEIKPKT